MITKHCEKHFRWLDWVHNIDITRPNRHIGGHFFGRQAGIRFGIQMTLVRRKTEVFVAAAINKKGARCLWPASISANSIPVPVPLPFPFPVAIPIPI